MNDMYLLYVLKKVVYTLNSPRALKKTTKKKGDKYITGTCSSVDKEKNESSNHTSMWFGSFMFENSYLESSFSVMGLLQSSKRG